MKKKLWLSALVASSATCLLLGLAACGGGGNEKVSGNLRFTLDLSTDTYSVSKNDSGGPLSGALEIPTTFQGKPVTRIGWNGFSGCSGLTSVTIPDSVTLIEGSAFSGCSGLTGELKLPDSVTMIGSRAFSHCSGLTGVTIPESVDQIRDEAFNDCSALASVTWNASNCTEASRIFGNCENLSDLTFGNNVKMIPASVFFDCSGLTGELELPDSVTSIGDSAFYGCSGFTGELKIPASVTSIGGWAFTNCSGFTGELKIPASVTSIGENTFYKCSGLTDLKIAEGMTSVGEEAFKECSELKSVVIPNSVTSIGKRAFEKCDQIESITLPFVGAGEGADAEAGDGAESGSSDFGYIFGLNTNHDVPDSLKTVVITGGKSIENDAFSWCDGITSITLPDSVTSIGKEAFENCHLLTNINIPENVTSIGEDAFHSCNSLTSIEIPEGVTSIGNGTFQSCGSLTSIEIPESVTSIGDGAFYFCNRLSNIALPDGLTSIGENAFYCCYGLTTITIPKNMTSIGYAAFSYCHKLVEVWNHSDLPITAGDRGYGQVATLAKHVYTGQEEGCQTVTDDGFIFYEDGDECYLLGYCGDKTELTFPDQSPSKRLYKIYQYALCGYSPLTSIEIGSGVTEIGEYAFSSCDSLTNVIWNAVDCTSAVKFAISGNINSVTFGKNVRTIPGGMFYNCTWLTSIEIPDGVTSIETNAFRGCTELKSIKIPSSVTSIGYGAFQGCTGITSIEIPSNVTTIESVAFKDCTELTSVIWNAVNCTNPKTPANEHNIFPGCEKLSSLTFGNNVKTIPDYAFSGCSGLTGELKLPDSVTSIGKDAFSGCSGLTGELRIPAGVTSIGEAAFWHCGGFEHITVDERNSVYHSDGDCLIVTDSNMLLLGCKNSAIPDGVTSIGEDAFNGCSDLKSIEIPVSVTSIGQWAFENCNSLTTVYYEGTSAEWRQVEILGNNSCLTSAKVEYLHDKLVQAVEASLSANSYAVSVENKQSKTVLKERFDFANKIVSTEIENLAGETLFKSLCAVTEGKVYMYSDASGVWLRAEGTGDPATYMQTANPLTAFKTEWEAFKATEKSARKNTAGEYVIGGYALTFADGSIATLHDTKTDSTITFTQFNSAALSLPTLGQADEAVHKKFIDGIANSASATTFHAEWTLDGVTYASDIETGKSAFTEASMQNTPMMQMYRECTGETLTLWTRTIDLMSMPSLKWMAWQKQTMPEGADALRTDMYLQNAASFITAGGNDPELLFIFAKYDAATDTFAIKDFDASGELFDYTLKISDGYITEWKIGNKTWLQSLDTNADSLTIYYDKYNEAEVSKPQDIA